MSGTLTSKEILFDYQRQFAELEDEYWEYSGHYPEPHDKDFYTNPQVEKLEVLIYVWARMAARYLPSDVTDGIEGC